MREYVRKNKFLLCIVIIGILCFGVITAYAISVNGDYQGGSIGSGSSSRGENLYVYPYVDAIRVSLVKSDGTNIGSMDFVDNTQYSNNTGTQVKATNRCSRAGYANGKCSLSWKSATSMGNISQSVTALEALFKDVTYEDASGNTSKYSFTLSLASKVSSNSFTGIFDGLYKEKNNLPEDTYNKVMYALLERLLNYFNGGKIEDYLVAGEANALYDLFIVFEPVSVMRLNNELYFGTAYELAAQGGKTQGGKTYDENGKPYCSSSSTALCDLATPLKKTIPCKTYLSGSIIDSMKAKQSTILIKNFPDGYYFSKIKLDYSNTNKICSSSNKKVRLDNSVASGYYGVGMGVIWVSDFYSGEQSCASIISGITWNWQGAFETAFNASGIDGIYDMFKAQVSSEYPYGYIAYNNGAGKADLKWFINQCTCYGMYDHYTKTFAKNYILNNQDKIIEISGSFGDNDWYMPTNLYEVNAEALDSIFNSAEFTQYNNENKLYAEQRGLPWDNATKDKYVDALKCGIDEKKPWCPEFEDWYEETRKEYSKLRSYPTINQFKKNYTNQSYIDKVQTMIDAYNVQFYPLNGFNWTLEADDSGNNYSYIKHCINAETANCQTIIDFYKDNQNKDLTKLSCETFGNNFDFTAFNNRFGTDITGQWFAANCPCSESTTYNCTPNYSVGSCTNNDDILYTDSSNGIINDEYWKNCVFDDIGEYDIDPHKVSDHGNALTYFEKGLGDSEYCEVYCIEDLSASLAKPNINVEAGSRFTWGYSKVEGSRTCKTKTVEWDKFEDDLKAANEDIVRKYVEWQLEIKYADAIRNASVSRSTYRTAAACRGSGKDRKCSCSYGGCQPRTRCRYTGNPSRVEHSASTSSEYGYYDYDDSQRVSWSKTYSGYISCPSPSSFVSSMTDVTGKKRAYDEAVEYAQSLIEKMKKCYTWDQSTVYEVDPQAKIFYSDDINYNYSDDLDKTTSYSFRDESICVSDKAYPIKSCSGTRCPTTSVTMKNCSGDDRYVQMTRRATTRFLLKEGVFRYVLKSNHLSVHQGELPSGGEFTVNYIDIGFSNFPVSFSAPAGLYGTKHNMGQFDVEYSNLGHVESGKTDIDTIMSGSTISQGTGEEYGKWICEYEVYADLLPEDPDGPGGDPDGPGGGPGDNGGVGDIDLIYRPIDLHDPFPDIDASYRDTGANWCDEENDCSYDNYSVQTYIFENRDVNYEEVYDLEPMYTFILTPSIIKEIREYNDSNSYASYTGSLGTAQHFDYVCEEGTGQACISDYLSYIIDITGAKDRPGACVDDKFRNANDSGSFYGCRY